jgi:thioredoxin 1
MEITSIELQEKINNGEKIIVDFHGLWCGPCKMMKPIFEKVANDNDTEVQLYTMDVDLNTEMAVSLGIRSIPVIKIFDDGQLVDSKLGVLNETQIKELISNLLLN